MALDTIHRTHTERIVISFMLALVTMARTTQTQAHTHSHSQRP